MSKIVFDPEAKKEFLESVIYYEENRPGLGRQFKQTVESATSSIADHPLRYRTIRSPFKRYLLQKFPFSIIYTIEPDHIYIVAIAHNRRKPEYWSDRPKSHSE